MLRRASAADMAAIREYAMKSEAECAQMLSNVISAGVEPLIGILRSGDYFLRYGRGGDVTALLACTQDGYAFAHGEICAVDEFAVTLAERLRSGYALHALHGPEELVQNVSATLADYGVQPTEHIHAVLLECRKLTVDTTPFPDIEICRVSPEDSDACAAAARIYNASQEENNSAERESEIAREMGPAEGLYLAFLSGVPCGVACASASVNRVYIHALGVDERMRGRKVASALIDFLTRCALSAGKTAVCYTGLDNPASYAVLSRTGFLPTGTFACFWYDID